MMAKNITQQQLNNIIVSAASQAAFSPTFTVGKIVAETHLKLKRKLQHSHQEQKQDDICSDQNKPQALCLFTENKEDGATMITL